MIPKVHLSPQYTPNKDEVRLKDMSRNTSQKFMNNESIKDSLFLQSSQGKLGGKRNHELESIKEAAESKAFEDDSRTDKQEDLFSISASQLPTMKDQGTLPNTRTKFTSNQLGSIRPEEESYPNDFESNVDSIKDIALDSKSRNQQNESQKSNRLHETSRKSQSNVGKFACINCKQQIPVDLISQHLRQCMRPDIKPPQSKLKASNSQDTYKDSFADDVIMSGSKSSLIAKSPKLQRGLQEPYSTAKFAYVDNYEDDFEHISEKSEAQSDF